MLHELAKNHELISLLVAGGVAVIRTDTLYGIVARADNETAVERVYAIKGRDAEKSCVVLLDSMANSFGAARSVEDRLSVAPTSWLVASGGAPKWLLRANDDIAYRTPGDADLRAFLAQTGPLIAPSANPQGMPPARSVDAARAYFGNLVDSYIDGGEVPIDMPPSRIVRVHSDGTEERLR